MISLDLIEFSDFKKPIDIVDEIIRQNPEIQVPIPLEEIAQVAGIQEVLYQPLDALEGALLANKYKSEGVILVNSNQKEFTRKRFTLGHELGHFMIPTHGHNMQCSINNINCSKNSDDIEREANEFSSEIIMPDSLFCNHRAFIEEPSISNIKRLAKDFNVSFEACVKKYINKHTDPLIVIFLHKNKFRYYQKSTNMPFWFSWKAGKGASVPSGSLCNTTLLNSEEKVYKDNVPSRIWLKESIPPSLPTKLVEEVYVQTKCYSVVLLKFELGQKN